jgi:hypothetical protein
MADSSGTENYFLVFPSPSSYLALNLVGRHIVIDLLEIGVNVVDWIGLAQDRYRWRALVNSVMNLRVA